VIQTQLYYLHQWFGSITSQRQKTLGFTSTTSLHYCTWHEREQWKHGWMWESTKLQWHFGWGWKHTYYKKLIILHPSIASEWPHWFPTHTPEAFLPSVCWAKQWCQQSTCESDVALWVMVAENLDKGCASVN